MLKFFDMVLVEDCTARGICVAIKNSLYDKAISMNDLMRYSSDTTNVMFADNESVVTLLKQDYPSVITVRYSFHMIHLSALCAC